MKTLEELAVEVWNQGLPPVRATPPQVLDYTRRLVAALDKQAEPVAWQHRFDFAKVWTYCGDVRPEPSKGFEERPLFLHASAPVIPDGWVLVPIEPTNKMLVAMINENGSGPLTNTETYNAALAAAPKPEGWK